MTQIHQVSIYPDGRLDTRNAARYIGVSEKTLAMWRCQGTGPAYIKPGRVFYYKEDLDEWLNKGGRLRSTAQSHQGKGLG